MEEPLNNLEVIILGILENHRSKENAIPREQLVGWVCDYMEANISDRLVRMTIKHLVTQHGVAIGSCHRGYFMAITPQEIEGVCKYYDSYGLSSLFVSARLKKIEMKDYLGQLSMRFT